jgi:ribose transport system substrate-binding protein
MAGLGALGLLAGCGGGGTPAASGGNAPVAASGGTPSAGSKGVIGVSVLTLTNPFFTVIGDSLTAEAKKHGYEVALVSGEFDVAKQRDQVKDFIARNCAAIVLTPCDSKAIGPAIQEANEAGIPVFTADIAALAPGAKVVSHIATDNHGGGKEAGNAMIEALGEAGGKIAILDFPKVESCIMRVKGFKEVIAAHNAGKTSGKIDIVSTLDAGGAKDQGKKVAEDILQAHPDIVGIFAINDPSGLGARAALEQAGKADQVKIIAFDGQPEGKQAIKDGKIYADPVQFPDRIGRETVNAIVKHFAGEEVDPEILIPTALYRKADAEKDPALR